MVRLAPEVVDERAAVGKPLQIAFNEIGTLRSTSERLHMAAVEPRHSKRDAADPKEQTHNERICAESRDSHVLV